MCDLHDSWGICLKQKNINILIYRNTIITSTGIKKRKNFNCILRRICFAISSNLSVRNVEHVFLKQAKRVDVLTCLKVYTRSLLTRFSTNFVLGIKMSQPANILPTANLQIGINKQITIRPIKRQFWRRAWNWIQIMPLTLV